MKRLRIVLTITGWLLGSWLLGGCTSAETPVVHEGMATEEAVQVSMTEPTVTPRPRPTPRVPNRVYYTKRCWPACHYDPQYVHDSVTITTDEFEGGLDPEWSWLNEDPTHRSLEEPGVLRIVTQPADLGRLEEVPNVLLRAAPETHFDILTDVTVAPTANGQGAVLFIQMTDGQIVSLIRGYCDEAPVCVGGGVYLGSTMPDCPPAGLPFHAETASLMLRRSGNSYIGYVLEDEEWVEVGRCFGMLTPAYVGLTAVNDSDDQDAPQIPVDFDFFTLVERH